MKYTFKKRNINLCLACNNEYSQPNMIIPTDPKCPHCGAYLHNLFGKPATKFVRSEVWITTSVWYKPWTWWDGFWKAIIGQPQVTENKEDKRFDY